MTYHIKNISDKYVFAFSSFSEIWN